MALQFLESLRNTWLDSLTSVLDGGAGAGILAIYSGSKPATVATALSGNTLLAQIPLADPSSAAASGGVLTIDADPDLTDSSANATGTATWFRVYSSADGTTISEANAKMQGTVTATGGGGDLELNTVSIVSGQPVVITSGSITAPGV